MHGMHLHDTRHSTLDDVKPENVYVESTRLTKQMEQGTNCQPVCLFELEVFFFLCFRPFDGKCCPLGIKTTKEINEIQFQHNETENNNKT